MSRQIIKIKIIHSFLIICLLASIIVLGCSEVNQPSIPSAPSTSSVAPKYGGIFKISKGADSNLSGFPPNIAGGAELKQLAPALETLLHIDENGNLVPWLSTGYEVDAAKNTITLSLRKGVIFHDGTDFNAAAVKWNLEQQMALKKDGTQQFQSIDILDDYTVRINLTGWESTIPANLCMYVGVMISPTAFQKNGKEWCDKNPVGTGPFKFVSWKRDVLTVYKKFENYWQKGKPYVDEIHWVNIVDNSVAAIALKSGEIDARLGIDTHDMDNLEKDGFTVLRIFAGSSGVPQNPYIPSSADSSSPFSNLKIRQAASYAIDSAAVVKSVFNNQGISMNQWAAPGTWAYNPAVTGYPYNPSKAKQLLAEAGYPDGFKTKIIGLTSQKLAITAMAGYLKQVGINADIELIEMGRYTQFTRQRATWDGILQGVVTPHPDPVAALAARYLGTGPNAFSQLLTPSDYRQSILDAISAPDNKKKQEHMREGIKLMIDKYCLVMPLWSIYLADATAKYVINSQLNKVAAMNAQWAPEEVWLDK